MLDDGSGTWIQWGFTASQMPQSANFISLARSENKVFWRKSNSGKKRHPVLFKAWKRHMKSKRWRTRRESLQRNCPKGWWWKVLVGTAVCAGWHGHPQELPSLGGPSFLPPSPGTAGSCSLGVRGHCVQHSGTHNWRAWARALHWITAEWFTGRMGVTNLGYVAEPPHSPPPKEQGEQGHEKDGTQKVEWTCIINFQGLQDDVITFRFFPSVAKQHS